MKPENRFDAYWYSGLRYNEKTGKTRTREAETERGREQNEKREAASGERGPSESGVVGGWVGGTCEQTARHITRKDVDDGRQKTAGTNEADGGGGRKSGKRRLGRGYE